MACGCGRACTENNGGSDVYGVPRAFPEGALTEDAVYVTGETYLLVR